MKFLGITETSKEDYRHHSLKGVTVQFGQIELRDLLLVVGGKYLDEADLRQAAAKELTIDFAPLIAEIQTLRELRRRLTDAANLEKTIRESLAPKAEKEAT